MMSSGPALAHVPGSGSEAHAPRRSTVRLAWWAALVGLSVILAVPLPVVDVPPLLDYPNHLARIYMLPDWPSERFRLLIRSGFAALYAIDTCEANL
jgi:hypothetical protein